MDGSRIGAGEISGLERHAGMESNGTGFRTQREFRVRSSVSAAGPRADGDPVGDGVFRAQPERAGSVVHAVKGGGFDSWPAAERTAMHYVRKVMVPAQGVVCHHWTRSGRTPG